MNWICVHRQSVVLFVQRAPRSGIPFHSPSGNTFSHSDESAVDAGKESWPVSEKIDDGTE